MSDSGLSAPAPAANEKRRAGRRQRGRFGAFIPYLLLAPAALFMAAFFVWPLVQALLIAFETADAQFTLDNFRKMAQDSNFGLALRNTLILLALIIPIETAIALVMAAIAQSRLRAHNWFLYFWSIPLAISDLAAGLIWFSVFSSHGYLNSLLQDLHLIAHPAGFLDYNNLAGLLTAIVMAEVWRSISVVMVVILSGLQSIPREVLEAAESLGASAWLRFRHVTLPLLKPSIQVALIMRTTAAFSVFAVVVAMTSAYHVLAGEAYIWVNDSHNYQLAATYGVIIMLLSSAATTFYLIALRTRREVFGR